ncbi:MAG: OmpA family protein, partial [Breznakibacter sp.]|nr:OmpA family protein [Breznakibacter sp.]
HTCDLGAENTNYRLGLKRANALVLAFEQAGKERSKMTPSSKGELQPTVPNTSNENRKKNRRVVVVIEDIE